MDQDAPPVEADDNQEQAKTRSPTVGLIAAAAGALALFWGLLPALGFLPMLKALTGGSASMDASEQAKEVLAALLARWWIDLVGAVLLVVGLLWLKRARQAEGGKPTAARRASRAVVALVILLMLSGSAFAGGMYAADYQVEATIVDKECAGPVPEGFDPETGYAIANGTERPDPSDPDPEQPDPEQPEPGSGQPEQPDQDDVAGAADGLFGENSTVTIRAVPLGVPFELTVTEFPDEQCWPLRSGEDGNFITVNIRTERAVFYEREGGTCIFDTLFGLGCILPELAAGLQELSDLAASTSFALSTSGYAADPFGLGFNTAANCATFTATDETALAVVANWVPTATDTSLLLRIQVFDAGGTELDAFEATGGSPLEGALELPDDAAAYTIAMFPDSEAVGTTGTIAVSLSAEGVESLPEPSPEPCS
ncbi:MAG: hypothetical protein ACPGQL_05455 [Thermoplasmatota archaeon]